MEAVYFGTGYGGGGRGPWIGADLEVGIYGGPFANHTWLHSPFVTAMVKGGTNGFATKGADATRGKLLKLSEGPRPEGYQPMHKAGAIILGVGGDNSNRAAAAAAASGSTWQDSTDHGGDVRPGGQRSMQSGSRGGEGGPMLSEGVPGMSVGTFYEGLMTVGYTTDAADDAVQADIVAAKFGQ